jgi:hypothetical protein
VNPTAFAIQMADGKIKKSGYPEKTSGIECGSGFQPRQLISRLEAAPTEGLSNETWTFQISRLYLIKQDLFSQ